MSVRRRLDQVEQQIILLLQEDGRMSTADMARRTGASEPTIRRKLNRLLADGIMRVVAVADPTQLGYSAPAYIGLDVDRPRIKKVAAALARYPAVASVAVATGPYDIIIEAAFAENSDLYDFVLNELTKFDGIKDSHSFLVLQRFKQAGHQGVAGTISAPPAAGAEERS